ncbi:Glucose receptor Git3 [Macrophomina phaseolina MS6]|uniref:Glucose receptor Git3 n=1 Tax=Macrophomina phaseolina (strain MS6) TaxID=1126212 RepID=K2S9E4_MACPH|nr:Glucose receptor Git3 [Macrophomina phaseolina MS6]
MLLVTVAPASVPPYTAPVTPQEQQVSTTWNGAGTPRTASAQHVLPRWHTDGPEENVDYIFLFGEEKKFIVQVATVVGACISLSLVTIAFLWLIMLLILGDWMRALCTHTCICQAAGYLIQMGTEISDFSVLFISIHGATQIFKPPVTVAGRDDRLYKYRRWIYAFILIVPQVFASLPFIGDGKGVGYLSQGAFCTLPIRPIWYRLALAWIPRLLIWFTILGLAVAIYVHVHREFRDFSEAFRRHSTTSTDFLSDTPDGSPTNSEKRRDSSPNISPRRHSLDPGMEQRPTEDPAPVEPVIERPQPTQTGQYSYVDAVTDQYRNNDFGSSVIPLPAPAAPTAGRRNSRVRIEIPTGIAAPDTEVEVNINNTRRKSFSDSLRSWRSTIRETCANPVGHRPSLPISVNSERTDVTGRNSIWQLSAFFNTSRRSSDSAKNTASRARHHTFSSSLRAERKLVRRTSEPIDARMAQKRSNIRRQLRQVFVYPLVYICLWLIPFTALCLAYNPRYARRPPFVLNMLSNFCPCFIGAVNVVVFSWREKPWRYIHNNPSRGFWQSFCFWREDLDDDNFNSEYYRQRRRRSSGADSNKRWNENTYVENKGGTGDGV